VVFLCLHVVLCVQAPISAKREHATQTQKAEPAAGNAESAAFNVGKFPIGITFDGTNIWVGNMNANTVTKLLASDGSVVGTFVVCSVSSLGPLGLAFDGINIWVANQSCNTASKM